MPPRLRPAGFSPPALPIGSFTTSSSSFTTSSIAAPSRSISHLSSSSSPRNPSHNKRRQQPPSNSRSFSQTCHCQARATRLRRQMFAWLYGPGRSFQRPMEGAGPKYLGSGGGRREIEEQEAKEAEEEKAAAAEEEEQEADELRQLQLQEGEGGEEGVEAADAAREERVKGREEDAKEKEKEKERQAPARADARFLRPFPLNRAFVSQPVLSEELREAIWTNVVKEKKDIMVVGARFHVSLERVAAVVRMKQIEKDWEAAGKKLCTPYANSVMTMLPQTPLKEQPVVHEPINDLPVHYSTRQQLFVPTSESRAFTRADAAKAFAPGLRPADERIPNTAILFMEKLNTQHLSSKERQEAIKNYLLEKATAKQQAEQRANEKEERETTVVKGRRWDFKFTEVNASQVSRTGRSVTAAGWRYGMPHEDRKRGQVKIPTHVS